LEAPCGIVVPVTALCRAADWTGIVAVHTAQVERFDVAACRRSIGPGNDGLRARCVRDRRVRDAGTIAASEVLTVFGVVDDAQH
jgi:hypothetical protein